MRKVKISIPVPERPASLLLKAISGYPLLLVLLAPSILWIAQDHSVWPWDQAWYAQTSTDLWHWLLHTPVKWLATMADGMDIKPPAISWIGQFFVPLQSICGSTEVALLLFVIATQFLLLMLLFRIARSIAPSSPLVPILAVVFAAGGQLFTGLSHQYFVEPLQAVAVAWTLLIAVKGRDWPQKKIFLHLGASVTLGLLTKVSTPVYFLLPLLYSLRLALAKPRPDDSIRVRQSLLFRLLALLVAGIALAGVAWYLRHFGAVLQHARDSTSGEIASQYGPGGGYFASLSVWLRLFDSSFVSPFLLVGFVSSVAVAIFMAIMSRQKKMSVGGNTPVRAVLALCAIQIVLLFFVCAASASVDSRYIYATLPYIVILFAGICATFPNMALAALVALCGLQWGVVNYASLATTQYPSKRSEWLTLPKRDRSHYDELTRLVKLTSEGPEHNNMIGVQEPWLNENSAAFFASKERMASGHHGYYVSAGYAQQNLAAVRQRMQDYHTEYVVELAEAYQQTPPDFLNLTALPLLTQLRADSGCEQEEFATKNGIVMFHCAGLAATTPDRGPDLSVVPPAILSASIEAGGKSALDALNGNNGTPDGATRMFAFKSGKLSMCDGWAFDNKTNATPENVWIELTNTATQKKYYWPTRRYSRPALAAALKLPSIERAGIACNATQYELPSGVYKIRVFQVEGKSAIASDFSTYSLPPVMAVH